MSLMSDIATAIKNKFILNDFSSQSNSLLTGGGTISVSATWEVKWSTRFLIVSNGRGAALATAGYFNIIMPAVSTVITGAGGATNKTVTANGIPLGADETLYYILPLGTGISTVNANFRVCSYTADINIPNNWIKICSKSDDGGYVDFACGISLRNNTSINTHLYDVKGADVDGAVSSANTLATARTISASGDIVGTATSFNGSANITIPMTLATIVDSGTGLFKKITTNAKGLVTGTTNVVQSDITGLLGSGSITNTMIANTAVSNLSGTNTGDQTITLTGDITGTGNGSFATTLSNSGVTAGTYSKMTVDSKGRITAGFTQTMEDIPDATFKRSVKAATTANITLSAPQTVDGIALVAGDRVLVKNQTTTSQNGIYVVAAAAWARALDADSASEISSALVAVDTGTINGGKLFDNDFKTTDTLGTTAMVWNANLDDGALLTSGSTSIGIVKYNGTTAAAGQFDGGTTTPTGSTRLNYGGYFYPTYVNLLGTADTTTASSHVFVETASDGYVRPKTLANFRKELEDTIAANIVSAATTTVGTIGLGDYMHITGTTTITSFGTATAAGIRRTLIFDGALTITHNATSLICPGDANIVTVAGTVIEVIAETTANWRVVSITHPSLSMAELSYLDGVTSSIQTQLDAKVARTSTTGSAVLPAGTTAQRDGSPLNGYIRYNTDLLSMEGYINGSWGNVGGGAVGGGTNKVFYENDLIVSTNYTITAGKSAMSTGDITINNGVVVTIPTGSKWVIL